MTGEFVFGFLAVIALVGWGWTNWKWSQTLGNIVVSKVRHTNEFGGRETRRPPSDLANPHPNLPFTPPIGDIPPAPDLGPINDVVARMREGSNNPDVWPVDVEESA